MSPLARLGAIAAQIPTKANDAFDFSGRCAAALPKLAAAPGSVDWCSLPKLMQEIGADGLPVASAANLLDLGAINHRIGSNPLARRASIPPKPSSWLSPWWPVARVRASHSIAVLQEGKDSRRPEYSAVEG